MLAMILSRVLLPDPLRPTIPKNSPRWMSNDTSRSAWSSRCSTRVKGWIARSLSVSTRCSGILNVLWIPRASITTGPRERRSPGSEWAGSSNPSTMVGLLSDIYTRPRCSGGPAHDRIRVFGHGTRGLLGVRRGRHQEGGRAGFGDPGDAGDRLDLPLVQRAAGGVLGPGGPGGAGAGPPGRGDRGAR